MLKPKRLTKTSAGTFYSYLLKSTRLKTPLTDPEGVDFLYTLFGKSTLYNHLVEKSKEGIHISFIPRMIEIARGRRVRMFCAEYIKPGEGHRQVCISKGKLLDQAFKQKTKSKKKSSKEIRSDKIYQVQSALRLHIEPQIQNFRERIKYPYIHAESGSLIYQYNKTHVDHDGDWPFIRIVEEWLKEMDLYYASIKLVGPPTAKRLKDPELVDSWIKFHKDKARLTLAPAEYNMSKGANNWTETRRWKQEKEENKSGRDFE